MTTATATPPAGAPNPDEPPSRTRMPLRRLLYLLGAGWVLLAPFYISVSGTIEFLASRNRLSSAGSD